MAKSVSAIRRAVRELLAEHEVVAAPVPVERVARRMGVIVKYQPFKGELAGMLVNTGDQVVIGVNALHHTNRQRFTIAHELGHLNLHSSEIEGIHVDRTFKVHRRDEFSALAVDQKEIEANKFAAELLMPYDLIMEDIEDMFDAEDEEEISALAKKYQVSSLAMTHRINNLLQLHKNWG